MGGEIGIHEGLKIPWPHGRAGSSPAPSTHSQVAELVTIHGLLRMLETVDREILNTGSIPVLTTFHSWLV